MEALRIRRSSTTNQQISFEEKEVETKVVSLTNTLTNFWDIGRPLTNFKVNIKPPIGESPVLKRLGQPLFLDDDLLKLLGPAYRSVTETSIANAANIGTEGTNEETGE